MAEPLLTIDLDKIEHNARSIVARCRAHGIAVSGVTKGCCGTPAVARAMLRGGVQSLADSRLRNCRRLRAAGIDAPLMLLRIPPRSQARAVVRYTSISLNSELAVLEALAAAARSLGCVHDVMVMVDLGDLREGLWPDQLPGFLDAARSLEGLRIVGLGTNLSCYAGVVPSQDSMAAFVCLADAAEAQLGDRLRWLSAGASNVLPMIFAGEMPARVNHVRVGEAILLGRETTHREALPDTWQDAFRLEAEIIELKTKPSVPVGELAEDAYGARRCFEDRGPMRRAIVNLGRQDVDLDTIQPLDPRLRVLGASSDHLLLDVSAASAGPRVGDRVAFLPGYGCLLAAMTSPYVRKRYGQAQQTG
jgi:predicted amino acid racemase